MRIVLCLNSEILSTDEQMVSTLESACKRVPGLRFQTRIESRQEEIAAAADLLRQGDESIFVVPLDIPAGRQRLMDWRKAVDSVRPLSGLCGLCFVMNRQTNLDPRYWFEPYWTEVFDDYAELALPSSFVVWADEDTQLKVFRLVAALSSLAREMESLAELQRLDDRVHQLEHDVVRLSGKIGS
jgi:hypothetical protein